MIIYKTELIVKYEEEIMLYPNIITSSKERLILEYDSRHFNNRATHVIMHCDIYTTYDIHTYVDNFKCLNRIEITPHFQ